MNTDTNPNPESTIAISTFRLLKIYPRKQQGTWLFDDPAVGLVSEPFVSGADDIIEAMADLEEKSGEQKAAGVGIYFADQPFSINGRPAIEMERIGFGSVPDAVQQGACGSDGAWYRTTIAGRQLEGWLCPATLKYFSIHPPLLYALIDSVS